MTILKSLTGRTQVDVTVSSIGEVAIDVTRNGQTLERLNFGREQDLNPTHRLALAADGSSVGVYEQGPDGERLVTTIAVTDPVIVPLGDPEAPIEDAPVDAPSEPPVADAGTTPAVVVGVPPTPDPEPVTTEATGPAENLSGEPTPS